MKHQKKGKPFPDFDLCQSPPARGGKKVRSVFIPILCDVALNPPQAGSLGLYKQSPPAWANNASSYRNGISGKMKGRITLFLLPYLLFAFIPNVATPQTQNSLKITVNSNQDEIKPDESVTLREAIALTNNTLSIDKLSEREKAQIQPAKGNSRIEFNLSAGDTTAKNVLICDRIPDNVTFLPTAFNSFATKNTTGLPSGDRGIIWQNNGATESLTNTSDGDTAEYLSPGVDPTIKYPGIKCDGSNTNGVVIVNLGNLPNAIAPGIPINSYGFIRFRGRVK